MPTLVLTNAFVSINGVDLSDHVRSVSLDYSTEILDATAMGDTTRKRVAGYKDWTLEVEFYQDFDANEVDATIFPLLGTQFAIEVKAVNAATSATNPAYQGTGLLETYPPLGNAVGEMAVTRVRIVAAGALTRATS